MKYVELSHINCKETLWPRMRHDNARVRTLKHLYAEHGPKVLPPVVVTTAREDGMHVLVDGWHRVEAARKAGLTALPAYVRELGTDDDVFLEAVRLSCGIALPLKAEEQKRAVVEILRRRPCLADTEVAKVAGIWREFVAEQRQKLEKGQPPFEGHPESFPEEALALRSAGALLQAAERLEAELGAGAAASLAEKAACMFAAEAGSRLARLEQLAREAGALLQTAEPQL